MLTPTHGPEINKTEGHPYTCGGVSHCWKCEKAARNIQQPKPVKNDNPAVWDLVVDDMRERDIIGKERYGVRLQAGNGRDALLDAYQEALDLVVYLRQAIYERDGK